MSRAAEKLAAAEPLLLRTDRNGVTTLTLNSPAQRNSLSRAMLTALTEALTAVASDASVRCVVLASSGTVFCSGHDLKELTAARAHADQGRGEFQEILTLCNTMMQMIVNLPKPVIARVHGVATAAGCQLVASCDLAIAADDTRFATPGVNIGLFCSTPMVALSRNVSRKHAMEMLLTGDMFSAAHAVEIGLINQAVPIADLDHAVTVLAEKIASKSSLTLAVGKQAFYKQLEKPLSEAYEFAKEVMVQNTLARDAEEGINAFMEKRAPVWQDK